MDNGESRVLVNAVFQESREFVIVGITGKTGAGTSDVADVLSSSMLEEKLLQPSPGEDFGSSEQRELRIIQRYIKDQWKPFTTLTATSVMLSFLLDSTKKALGPI